MIGESIAIIVLIGVILYQGWTNYDQRKAAEARENRLLDRIMSRDFGQLVQGEVAREQKAAPLTAEEIYEMQQEQGIPI